MCFSSLSFYSTLTNCNKYNCMQCSRCTTCMWCVEPWRHEDIRHTSFQLHPCGGLPTERCFRLAVLSLLLSFIGVMPGASWKTLWHNNAVAQGYSGPSPPTSVQAHTHQEQLALTLFVCARVFFTPLLACQGFFPQESSGVIVLFLIVFFIVLQGIDHASRNMDMLFLIYYIFLVLILSQVGFRSSLALKKSSMSNTKGDLHLLCPSFPEAERFFGAPFQ